MCAVYAGVGIEVVLPFRYSPITRSHQLSVSHIPCAPLMPFSQFSSHIPPHLLPLYYFCAFFLVFFKHFAVFNFDLYLFDLARRVNISYNCAHKHQLSACLSRLPIAPTPSLSLSCSVCMCVLSFWQSENVKCLWLPFCVCVCVCACL